MTPSTLDLPAFPQIAFDTLNLFFNMDPNARMIARSLGRDPGLVAHILAVANSPAFGPQQSTSDLLTAIGRLGLDNVRQILMEEAVAHSFPFDKIAGFNGPDLWHHSAFTGQIAFRLAKLSTPGTVSDVHIAGLLHDAGLFRLGIAEPDKAVALAAAMADGKSISLAERELGFQSHARLGFELVQTWHLPDNVAQMILFHETSSPQMRPETLSPELNRQIDVLHLADTLALKMAEHVENSEFPRVDAGLLKRIGLEATVVLSAVRSAQQYLDGIG